MQRHFASWNVCGCPGLQMQDACRMVGEFFCCCVFFFACRCGENIRWVEEAKEIYIYIIYRCFKTIASFDSLVFSILSQ